MHPADIKAALQKRGSSCADIAKRLDRDKSTVSQVVTGKGTSRLIALEIGRVIGQPVARIWPGRYEAKVLRAIKRKPVKRRSAGR